MNLKENSNFVYMFFAVSNEEFCLNIFYQKFVYQKICWQTKPKDKYLNLKKHFMCKIIVIKVTHLLSTFTFNTQVNFKSEL